MNIQQAATEIERSVRAYLQTDETGAFRIPSVRQRPLLLIGPPGIGKTQIMEQVAKRCGVALVAYTITHHTRQSAIGLPFIRERKFGGETRSVTEYTMSEIIASVYEKMEQTGLQQGILFLDEINCVSETLAPAMLQFLQNKTFGNQKLPDGWIIAAAGNPPEYNRTAREFDIVTLDRVKLLEVEEDFEVWKSYAYARGLHGAVVSYLDIRRENFYAIQNTVDGLQFATARGWEDLSEMLFSYEHLGFPIEETLVGEYIRVPKIARDFANYYALFQKYRQDYRVEEILEGKIPESGVRKIKLAPFDEKFSVVGLLISRLGEWARERTRAEGRVTALHRALADWKACLPNEQLEQRAEKEADTLATEKQAETLTREQTAEREWAVRRLNNWLQKLAGMRPPQQFEQAKVLFSKELDGLDARTRAASQALEHAFDFMEAAFGDSQEMVVFITELTADPHISGLIREAGCDRYYMYNKNLLFGEMRQELLQQVKSLQARPGGDALLPDPEQA